jgi:ATP/maltotriose-dependent transcriptional regulator MalT
VLTEAGHAAAPRAPAAAAHWFSAAERLLPADADSSARRALLFPLAAALATTGQLHESRGVLSRALDLLPAGAPATAIIPLIARIDLGLGRGQEAQQLLGDALAATEPDTAQAVELRIALAETHLMLSEWEAAAAEIARARRLADALDDPVLTFAATAASAHIAHLGGAIRRSEADIDAAVALLDQVTDADERPALHNALLGLVIAELATDRNEAALRHGRRALRACRATGQSQLFGAFVFCTAMARMLRGEVEEARQGAENAVEIALLLDNDQWLASTAGLHCWALTLRGDHDGALAAGALATGAASRVLRSHHTWLARVCHGQALLAAGRPDRAREALLSAGGAGLTEVPMTARPRWLRVLVEVELAAGRVDAAAAMLEQIRTEGTHLGLPSREGESHFAAAAVALALGDATGALRAAARAARCFDAAGRRIEAARARLLAGRAAALAGEPAAARRDVAAAQRAFQACGAEPLAAEAAAALQALDGDGRAAAASLTRRQGEIAALVAQGHTNRQIGAALHLSERTVEKHLQNMYGKLGVSSRAALAATITRTASA